MHLSLVRLLYFFVLCNILIINYIYINIYKNEGRRDMLKN